MTTEYWTCIGGRPMTSHTTLASAVDMMARALGETSWMYTVGYGGYHEVVDGEHAEMLASKEYGTIIIGYRTRERALADRDGAYPDAQVERQEV